MLTMCGQIGQSKSAHEYVAVVRQYLQLLLAQFGVPEVQRLSKISEEGAAG